MIPFRNTRISAADAGQQNFRAAIKQGQPHYQLERLAKVELFPERATGLANSR
jgi:hypothetical protein